jgi:hypothetical protein
MCDYKATIKYCEERYKETNDNRWLARTENLKQLDRKLKLNKLNQISINKDIGKAIDDFIDKNLDK